MGQECPCGSGGQHWPSRSCPWGSDMVCKWRDWGADRPCGLPGASLPSSMAATGFPPRCSVEEAALRYLGFEDEEKCRAGRIRPFHSTPLLPSTVGSASDGAALEGRPLLEHAHWNGFLSSHLTSFLPPKSTSRCLRSPLEPDTCSSRRPTPPAIICVSRSQMARHL